MFDLYYDLKGFHSTYSMKVSSAFALVGLSLHIGTVAAYLEDPPTEAAPDTIQDCSWWHVAESGDSCDDIAAANGISLSDFNTVYVNSSTPYNKQCNSKAMLTACSLLEPVGWL